MDKLSVTLPLHLFEPNAFFISERSRENNADWAYQYTRRTQGTGRVSIGPGILARMMFSLTAMSFNRTSVIIPYHKLS